MNTEKIWNNFNAELLRFIRSRVKDDAIANDLLQEVFIKIHLNLPTLTDSEKLKSWIYQITRNNIIDHYRKHKYFNPIPYNLSELEETESLNADFGKCIKPFVSQLPPIYREAIMQTDLGELSQKEYAEKSEISYSAAKSRIQRGRKILYELFSDCCHISADKYGNITEYERKQECKDC